MFYGIINVISGYLSNGGKPGSSGVCGCETVRDVLIWRTCHSTGGLLCGFFLLRFTRWDHGDVTFQQLDFIKFVPLLESGNEKAGLFRFGQSLQCSLDSGLVLLVFVVLWLSAVERVQKKGDKQVENLARQRQDNSDAKHQEWYW